MQSYNKFSELQQKNSRASRGPRHTIRPDWNNTPDETKGLNCILNHRTAICIERQDMVWWWSIASMKSTSYSLVSCTKPLGNHWTSSSIHSGGTCGCL